MLLKKSHFKNYKYSISNILRTIDLNLRKFRSLIFLKKIIKKIIGKDLKYGTGDLIIFYTTLYHARSVQKNIQDSYRSAAIARYGDVSMHSKTYLNYEMNYRQGLEKYKVSKKKDIFFQKLKDNNIYISPQAPIENIDGIFLPREKKGDSIYFNNKN